MTDPLEPPDKAPADPEHHGLGERVGDAVERVEERVEHAVEEVAQEVAEHVPEPIRAPVRWTVRKLMLVIGASLVAAILIGVSATAYYVWNHTEWAAHELTWRVNQVLHEHSDLALSVGGLRGNPLVSVEVVHPQVGSREGGAPLLEARSMSLRYSTWNLFAGKRGALVIELDQPVVRLERGPDGKLRVPEWRTGSSAPKVGRAFDYEIRIHDGRVVLPESEHSVSGFDLDAAVSTGGGTEVEIRSLSWKNGPFGVPLRKLVASVSAGDSIAIRVRQLDAPPIALHGEASWKRGEKRRAITAEIERVEWRWLARVFRNHTFDVDGQGAFSVQATQEDFGWTGATLSHGVWGDLPLEARGTFSFREGKLSMPSLAGRSPAGELSDGRLSWSKAGWELSGRAAKGDPARWGVLGLKNWPAGDLHGRFRYVVDTRGKPSSELQALLEPSALAGWRADSGVVRLSFPPDAPDSFRVTALRRGGRFVLLGRTEPHGWSGSYRVNDYPLDEWADGRATGLVGTLTAGEGSVEGREGGLSVGGVLEGRSTRWLGLDAARWRLTELRGRLLPTPELEANARLRDVLYLGIHFDSMATPVALGDRSLVMASLAASAGDTLVTMAAQAAWDEGSWHMTADQARVHSHQFDWVATEPVRLSGDRQGVTFERLVAADGDARLDIGGRWATPGGSYDWHAHGHGLDLARLGLPDSLVLRGHADAELAVRGVSGDPRWEFHGIASGPGMQRARVDSLELDLAGAPASLEVGRLAFGVGGGWIETRCQFRDMSHAWPDTLTPEGVTRWLADARSWSGHAGARAVSLDAAARALGVRPDWSGTLEGTLDLAGRPARPEFDVALQARPLAWRNVRLDEVVARAHYAEQRLHVEQLRGTREAAVSNVSGDLEAELAFGRSPKVLDAPMRWSVDVPNGNLSLLSILVPQIGYADGRFVVRGEVRGTPRHPEIDGTARIEDGKLRFAGRSELLEGVRARIRFAASSITLDTLTAVQKSKEREPGRVWAHGRVELPEQGRPRYRFNVSLRDFTAAEQGLYAARFDGDFAVADGSRVEGEVLPHITSDNVEVRRAVILYDFTHQSEAEQVKASTQKLYWTYHLHVHANDNLRWQPADGDIEFGADLNLDQTPEKLVMFGDMEALRGSYYFLSNRFTVLRAKLTFDDVGGVDPLVDAQATTRLTPSYSSAGSSADPVPHTITVNISGRSSAPTVEFQSDPNDIDEAQILRELTVGRFVANGSLPVPLVDPLDSYLTRAISRQLSGELSRAFRGYLTDWEIARQQGGVLGGQGGFVVGVGTQVTNQFMLRYRQLVPGTGRYTTPTNETLIERDIEAEYRINRFFYVTSQLTQKRTVAGTASSVSGTPDFNVSLKARWEY